MDPEWVRALEESANNLGEADSATAEAIAREERRALARLRKMAPSHIRTVLLKHGKSHLQDDLKCCPTAGSQRSPVSNPPARSDSL